MRRQARSARTLMGAGIGLLLVGLAGQADTHEAATYPKDLHGFWIPEQAHCPQVGESFDGDLMMDIGPDKLQGYEDISKPLKVALISKAPKAWRIESLIDIGPSGRFFEAKPKIFVLGEAKLTVVGETTAETFRRCPKR